MPPLPNSKPKLAIFHCGFIYTGGGERIVIEEILGFRARGYTIDCYVPTLDKALSYPDLIDRLNIKTFLPQLPGFIPLRFAFQMLASCLVAPLLFPRFMKYDVFLGANQPGAYMAWIIAKILHKPYFVYLSQPNRVLYPRDHENWQNVMDYYYLNLLINRFFRRFVSYLDKKSITSGENLFINGRFIAEEIVKIYEPKRWVDCPGGAHPLPVKKISNNRFRGKTLANGHTVQKPYILFTSRHEPWKRFDWAIEVTQKVIRRYPGVRLVIPGSFTSLTPELIKTAQDLEISSQVVFTGPINQKSLTRLYQNAAVYIFTSEREDLGIVVIEAQASAVPVVAWKTGGPTVTVKDRTTGFLIKPYDLEAMAEKIIFLLENPAVRNKMARAARTHIASNFSWQHHIDILESTMLS